MGMRRGAPPEGLRPASLAFLIFLIVATTTALYAVGCAVGPVGVNNGRDGGDGRDRRDKPSEASLGGAYMPAGFGEGSLWATDIFVCNDTSVFGVGGGACGVEAGMPIKRLDPQSGEQQAAVELEDFSANTTEVAFGAGSVWVSSADYEPGPVEERQSRDAVFRVDPQTNRLADQIPLDPPTGVAFGHGSVWSVSSAYGTLSRIDPASGEVVAKIKVGRGAVDVAVDEESGAVWVAGLYLPKDYDNYDPSEDLGANKLSRVDPKTNRVVAEIPVRADASEANGEATDGGAQNVAAGEGAVWVASVDGRLLEVDPVTNEVVATVSLGDYSSDLAVTGGSVWVSGQNRSGTWLKRVDPRTVRVDWSRGLGPVDNGGYGRLAAEEDGGGRVWFVEGGRWPGEGDGTLARISP